MLSYDLIVYVVYKNNNNDLNKNMFVLLLKEADLDKSFQSYTSYRTRTIQIQLVLPYIILVLFFTDEIPFSDDRMMMKPKLRQCRMRIFQRSLYLYVFSIDSLKPLSGRLKISQREENERRNRSRTH